MANSFVRARLLEGLAFHASSTSSFVILASKLFTPCGHVRFVRSSLASGLFRALHPNIALISISIKRDFVLKSFFINSQRLSFVGLFFLRHIDCDEYRGACKEHCDCEDD